MHKIHTHLFICHICRFAEKHRRLLNTLLRQNSSLLQGSLSPLLKVPRLIEFDNKRSYFRARIHSTGDDHRRYGGLRLAVRRSHVFEDSFHQMRMRYFGICKPLASTDWMHHIIAVFVASA